jgi:cinnamoyl-CoA:phenyllactate CoA-transferase
MKLLETTDYFHHQLRPQSIAKLGLDYENLKEKFPKLVYASFTGYGEDGPDKNLPGYDFTAYWARSGLQGTSNQKGTEPINLVPGIGDHTTGMFLAAGIMVALYNVQKTGKGDKVEINQLHSAIWTQGIVIQAAQYTELGTKISTTARLPKIPSTTPTRQRTAASSSCPCRRLTSSTPMFHCRLIRPPGPRRRSALYR